MTEDGTDQTGVFHRVGSFDDLGLGDLFAWEVLAMLVRKELLSPEWVERILSWRHTGFNVHTLVRTKTKPEAERVGKYMIRCGPDYRSSEADVCGDTLFGHRFSR